MMKCPNCNVDMKNGFVRPTGTGGICWTNQKINYGAPKSADGFFKIGKTPYLKGENIPAYNCDACKLIIIDYSED